MNNELSCTFDEFKKRTKFAIDQKRAGTLTEAEQDQLEKMVNLSYLNLSDFEEGTVSTQAPIVLQLFHREMGNLPKRPDAAFRTLYQFCDAMHAVASQ